MSTTNYHWTEQYLGSIIERYEITRLIGEGGMAAVFEATHQLIKNKVAIKILRPELSIEREIRERFKNEAKRMASLDHHNIPKVIGFEEQPKRLAIIMEYLEGEDLNKRIKRIGPLKQDEILLILGQILDALQYAHQKGIVHRDIKPSNIYLLPNNVVKILDFGIAKLFGEGEDGTRTGIQVGTPVYMSPEQVKGDRSIDHRSDIYSLGVTLYCTCNGSPPYDKNTLSDFDIFNKIVFEPLPDLTKDLSLKSFIKKACEKDRQNRFQSCTEWLEELNNPNFIYETSISEKQAFEEIPDENEEAPSIKKSKSPGLMMLIAGILILLVIIGVIIKNKNSSDNSQSTATDTDINISNISKIDTGRIYNDFDGNISVPEPTINIYDYYNDKIHIGQTGAKPKYEIEVLVTIGIDGSILNVDIEEENFTDGNDYGIKREINHALDESGKWKPATISGTPVKCKINVPFSFPKE